MKRLITVLALLLVVIAIASAAPAITLTDGNSEATFTDTSAKAYTWTVDGINHLYHQQWYFRIGDIGTVSELDTLGSVTTTQADLTGDGLDDILSYKYTGTDLSVLAKYSLAGGAAGSYRSDMGEQLKVTNNTRSSINLNLFQYVDWDLTGTPTDEGASISLSALNSATALQWDAITTATETVTPLPSHYQTAFYDALGAEFSDVNFTNLTDDASLTGLGDYVYAWQWSINLAPGDSFLISKDKSIISTVPEPSSMVAIVTGAVGLLGILKRRKS